MAAKGSSEDRRKLAAELAARCAPLLSAEDWEHVSAALGEMHDQLFEDIPDQDEFDALFAAFVANLIDRLGRPAVGSWDQARIYGASSNTTHQSMAADWIKPRQH
jgi:hypothetical protein